MDPDDRQQAYNRGHDLATRHIAELGDELAHLAASVPNAEANKAFAEGYLEASQDHAHHDSLRRAAGKKRRTGGRKK